MLGAIAALLLAASPVQGSVFGPIVSVSGSTFTITTSLSPTGKSKVSAGSATVTELKTVAKSTLKVGVCVMASGTRNSKGVVTATRITISQAVKGSCTNRFFRSGTRPNRPGGNGGTPPVGGFNRSGNFGFAFGSVTRLGGSTLSVKGVSFGSSKAITTTVDLTSTTSIEENETVKASAIKTKMCAFVNGTSADKGITVKAGRVALTPEKNGTCTNGFRRPS